MANNMIDRSKEARRESFWSLLSERKYMIYIPRIQRDYAQGRTKPEPTQIRKTFLKDIFDSLRNKTPLDVNFIYGNIADDKKGDLYFIPIDGQQRLTTLFLLHWYFAAWSGNLDEKNKEILKRFRYETRFTTGDFCNHLVSDVRVDLKELIKTDTKLTDVIKDYYWFFGTYDHDATIAAMLVMLQDIHDTVKQLENQDEADGFFDTLTSADGPISFLFLNIADVGLTDEIYIKMNARGKALTRFENFKAQLSVYLTTRDEVFARSFIANINGKWSQFFWNSEYRPEVESKDDKKTIKKAVVFDDQIMNLFRFIMMNEYIINVKIDDTVTETKYFIRHVLQSLAKESDFQFVNHLFIDEFRSVLQYRTKDANVDIEAFRFLNKLLNILAKRKFEVGDICFADRSLYDKEFINEEKYFKRLIRAVDEKPLTYEESIRMYAEFCFLVKYANEDDSFDKKEELTEWLRYVYNLSENTLYNGYDDYFRSIRRVKQIVDEGFALDILNYSATLLRRKYKLGSKYGFVENQMMEECIKSNLLLRDCRWRQLITEAENSFLGSQIAAILAFSGIWELYETEMDDYEASNENTYKMESAECILNEVILKNEYREAFELYLQKFNMIFDRDKIKPDLESNSLLRRALLTFGGKDSYMLPAGKPVCCFLDATDRDNSFRRLFRGDSAVNREYFKEMLDCIDVSRNIVSQLQDIISNINYDEESKWKKYFIEMPEILECMYQNKGKADPAGKFVFRNAKRYICKRSANQILLLEKTMTTSINREYYSYVLYLKVKAKGMDVKYFTTFSENTEKYMIYINNQDKEIQVIYAEDSLSKEYKYMARDNTAILYRGNIDNMIDYIQQTIK